MAGHSQFANIKHRKNAQDAKKAKIFTKLTREIITAVKLGGPDPEGNSRLRTAILAARVSNLPKDRIEGAVKRASSTAEGENYEEIRYEGYGPAGTAFIVEALTDNRNRTASEVRNAFTKHNGSLGETGSVGFIFDRVGMLEFSDLNITEEQFFEDAIETGASDIEVYENKYIAYTAADQLSNTREALVKKFGEPQIARLTWNPKSFADIDELEVAEKILKFIDALEDSDDVQFVTGNYRFSEKIINELK